MMNEKAVLYARISKEDQTTIGEQREQMHICCERNGWQILGEFVDDRNYNATKRPKKGRIVNPSGERDDRPMLLEMLKLVETGEPDVILYWREDRLVRHPRVASTVEDSLDIGDAARNGRPEIQLCDANGARLDRFTLHIKASVWREENKRRAERVKLGKIATLKAGRWPSSYWRYGYRTRKEPGVRGVVIEIDESEAAIVQKIYDLYDSGLHLRGLRRRFIAEDVPQPHHNRRKHKWSAITLRNVLTGEEYTGKATWRFSDGTEYTISIPQIISKEQWKRVQQRMAKNKQMAARNAKDVYLLQGIGKCGECGSALGVCRRRYWYSTLADGTRRRGVAKSPKWNYHCVTGYNFPEEPHPSPKKWSGIPLDDAVWRFLVKEAINHPDAIEEQILSRKAELQAQGDSIDSEIAQVRSEIAQLDSARTFYQRQAARGKITEQEFDARMDETEETRKEWQSELDRLQELRDDAAKVQVGIDYAKEFLGRLQARLPGINQSWDELVAMPEDKRIGIMKARREILAALVDTAYVYANGDVSLVGVLDGSEALQFGYISPKTIH